LQCAAAQPWPIPDVGPGSSPCPLTGPEPHPRLLGSAQSPAVMQPCQDVPCSGEVWPSGCSNLSSLCGTFSKPEFSNEPSPGCVPRVKPQHRPRTARKRSGLKELVHVCPDLLGSLADETRGETEQIAGGKPSDGRGGMPVLVGEHVPKGIWPAGNFMPVDGPGMRARYDDLIDGWAHTTGGKRCCVVSFPRISRCALRSAAESRSVRGPHKSGNAREGPRPDSHAIRELPLGLALALAPWSRGEGPEGGEETAIKLNRREPAS